MMKIAAFCLLLCMLVFVAPAQEILSNDSVLKMVKAGLSEDVIVSVVNSQPGVYTVTPDALVALKNAKVPAKVISAMVSKSQGTPLGAAPSEPAPAAGPASNGSADASAALPPAPAATTAPTPTAPAGPPPDLKSIHKIYIEKMPNDLDMYLRAEFNKQLKDRVTIVLKKEEADGIITGINEEQKGTAAKITGRYLGLHDTVNGTISLLDRSESNILWSNEAGDRNLFFGIAHRGGERKVADRLVSKLKKAMGY
jgi:hypothetical protein